MHLTRFTAVASLIALLISLGLGCSGGDDDDDGQSGGQAAAGNVGGTGGIASAVGGSPATGGSLTSTGGAAQTGGAAATAGGSPATGGSSTSTGGNLASGGSSASNLESRIQTACSNWQANAFVHGCTASYTDQYLTNCQAELNQAAQNCPAEVEALLDNCTMLTALDFQCDASDNITFAPGVCEAEQSALEQCQ